MAKEKKEKAIEETTQQGIDHIIYLGPSIAKYGLVNGQIYIGKSDLVEVVLQEYPEARNLFVPIDEKLCEMKMRIAKHGTAENILFNELKSKINGGK
ncbi:hypothetical protein IX317_001844 [Fusobacterium sp. DD29]|uniref:hypothetical protein n=1 Tax=unclassified Fusobacterium TaxID=2648384 RepID=UPI001B8B6677|nr:MULTISPECIES: hypothetical protein [unclassified Fusobacterium]MBR8701158.1 hypothetical protein [Fusobacterium sp. DD45]MBR8711329.1 hypothetical protein [Fusobacterium sp. DD28]MBR8750160.1 hypothetical protein [Fusobacterium sp. DD29]MBR8751878.1 hypothetical protein [Fusobacterium sp. DD26]MBR8762402.1 hypothetical protein [Fusobacterium sp. DD25]